MIFNLAPKGKGKTTTACNLLKFYRGYFHRIIIVSPTISSDEKWDWAKEQFFLLENKPLKKWLHEFIQQQKPDEIVQNQPSGELQELMNKMQKFTGKIPEEDFIEIGENLNEAEVKLLEILEDQKAMIELLHFYGQPKYLANRLLVILDDLVGSTLFKLKAWFSGVTTRHRHYGTSFIQMTQAYKEIPKTIRTNSTCLLVYSIGNFKEIQVIYEEFQNDLSWEDWYDAYRYATNEEHDFLFLNFQQEQPLRMMKNFQEFLFVVPTPETSRPPPLASATRKRKRKTDELPSYEEATTKKRNKKVS